MLPSSHRMRSSADFSSVVRRGRRARRETLVVHHLAAPQVTSAARVHASPAIVGLVVGRAVGSSVIRHGVSRRLRAQLSARLDRLPIDSGTVVRALPEAALVDSARLGRDLDAALDRLGLRTPDVVA